MKYYVVIRKQYENNGSTIDTVAKIGSDRIETYLREQGTNATVVDDGNAYEITTKLAKATLRQILQQMVEGMSDNSTSYTIDSLRSC